jgi:hypothetical protein
MNLQRLTVNHLRPRRNNACGRNNVDRLGPARWAYRFAFDPYSQGDASRLSPLRLPWAVLAPPLSGLPASARWAWRSLIATKLNPTHIVHQSQFHVDDTIPGTRLETTSVDGVLLDG